MTDRPHVTLKFAQTLDGRLATANGESKWITGSEARTVAHQLRAEHDAILVGIGTVLADDPQLTVRMVSGTDPSRVVLDSRLRIPSDARLISDGGKTLIFTALRQHSDVHLPASPIGVTIIPVAHDGNGLDLPAVLSELGRREIHSVLVEGGAKIITAFLRARLVDELAIFVAPKLLGAGRDSVESLGIAHLNQAITCQNVSYERLGDDVLVRGRVTWQDGV